MIQSFIIHHLSIVSQNLYLVRGKGEVRKLTKEMKRMENWMAGKRRKERERSPMFFSIQDWTRGGKNGGKKWNENYTSAPAASIIACLIRLDDFSARKSRARCSSIELSRKNSESALYRIMEILIQIGAMLFPCYINNAFSKFSFSSSFVFKNNRISYARSKKLDLSMKCQVDFRCLSSNLYILCTDNARCGYNIE